MTNFFSGEHRVTILGLGYRLLRHIKVLDYFQGRKRNILLETYNISKNDMVEKKRCFTLAFPYFPIWVPIWVKCLRLLQLRLRLGFPAADRGTHIFVFSKKNIFLKKKASVFENEHFLFFPQISITSQTVAPTVVSYIFFLFFFFL
jgi:hypothetical protein